MAPPKLLSATVGTIASLATASTIILHIILALSLSSIPPLRAGAIISTFLEVFLLSLFVFLFLTQVVPSFMALLKRWNSILLMSSLFTALAATVSCVATLVSVSNIAAGDPSRKIAGAKETDYLVGSGVALGLAFASQLLFIVVFFVLDRVPGLTSSRSSVTGASDESKSTPTMISPEANLKSVRYSRTMLAAPPGQRGNRSVEPRPPGSSAGHSTAETITSIRSCLSQAMWPVTSRTRLLSTRTRRSRTASLESVGDSHSCRRSNEEGFDSWDTSTVDAHNRQTVLESGSSIPGARLLETIPASPSNSRSPSPRYTREDIIPPRPVARRTKSYSPGPRRPRAPFMNDQPSRSSSSSEAHIHPLFRSDSPTPPPMASPGTVVMAAPNAGVVISDRASIRSLNRMRSGSLPCQRSPLSRQGSLENVPAMPQKNWDKIIDNHHPKQRVRCDNVDELEHLEETEKR